jgi:nitroreductase
MDTLKAILERRSIRKYRATAIPDPVLEEIVNAGLYAPSGMNAQPWHFVVVRSPEKMAQVRALMTVVAFRFDPALREEFREHPEVAEKTNRFLVTLGGAPACILVFAKPRIPDNAFERDDALESVSAAIENIQLAAWNRGIGSCWLGAPVRAECGELFEAAFAPDSGEFIAALSLGYPEEHPRAHKRKEGCYELV